MHVVLKSIEPAIKDVIISIVAFIEFLDKFSKDTHAKTIIIGGWCKAQSNTHLISSDVGFSSHAPQNCMHAVFELVKHEIQFHFSVIFLETKRRK